LTRWPGWRPAGLSRNPITGIAGLLSGRNARIEYRWAAADPDRLRQYADELAGLRPDVVLAAGAPAVLALQGTKPMVPIVFVQVIDPVGSGLVASLPRPGGNATGFVAYEYGMATKWPELLKQIAPQLSRVAVVRDPALSSGIARSPDMISDRLRRFRQGLKDTGYVEGENVTIVYDWAESFDRLSALAAELVRRPVAVIVTPTTPAAATEVGVGAERELRIGLRSGEKKSSNERGRTEQ
jgi:ABC-type uncharacterized transport system substrate-binding protein